MPVNSMVWLGIIECGEAVYLSDKKVQLLERAEAVVISLNNVNMLCQHITDPEQIPHSQTLHCCFMVSVYPYYVHH